MKIRVYQKHGTSVGYVANNRSFIFIYVKVVETGNFSCLYKLCEHILESMRLQPIRSLTTISD